MPAHPFCGAGGLGNAIGHSRLRARRREPSWLRATPQRRTALRALMPSWPAFGVKPCMRPRHGPEGQDYRARTTRAWHTMHSVPARMERDGGLTIR